MGEGLKEKKLEPNTYIQEKRERKALCAHACRVRGVHAQTQPNAADTKQGTKKTYKKLKNNEHTRGGQGKTETWSEAEKQPNTWT